MYIRRVAAVVAAILLAGLVNAAQLEESRVLQRSGALGAVAPRAAPKDEPTTSTSKSSSVTSSPTKSTEKPSPPPPSPPRGSSSSSSSSSISTSLSSTSSSSSRDTSTSRSSTSPRGGADFGPVPTPIPVTTSTHSTTKNTTSKTSSSSKPSGTPKPATSSSHTTSKVTGLSDESSKTTTSRTSKPSAPRVSGASSQSSASVSSATGSASGQRESGESSSSSQPTSSSAVPIASDVSPQVTAQGNNDGQVFVSNSSGLLHNKQATILVFTFAAVIAIGLFSFLGWCCLRRRSRQDKHVMLDEKDDTAAFGRSNSTGSRSSRRARPVSVSSDSSVGGWHYMPARFAGVGPMRQATLADRLAEDPFSVHRVVYPDMPPPEGGVTRRTYALYPDPPTPSAAAAPRPSSRSQVPTALDVAMALRGSTASGRPYSPESQYDEESVYAGVQRRPYMIERRPERRSSPAQAI